MSKKNFLESNNPMMKDDVLRNSNVLDSELVYSGELMTVGGAVNKTFILGAIALAAAVVGAMFASNFLILGGFIGAAVVSFITSRNPEKSPVLAPVFAALEGLAVGGVTIIYASMFDGIVFSAVSLTFAILFTMLMLYKSGLIKVTERFRNIVMTATGAIMLLYAASIALYFFGIDMPFLHDQSPIGIGISLLIVGVASMKLLVDFDNFDKGEQRKTPAYMEWYFGMGLLFTLIWLYLEILYLLSNFLGGE